jgi:tetratricopeptide (TPR) repeat protein
MIDQKFIEAVPMATAQTNPPALSAATIAELKKKKVLIVEDFNSFRSTVRKMLQSFGLTDIDEAPDGEDAVSKMSRKKYDIIICDYNLGPGKDGQQILEEARACEYMDSSTIFIMATAENTMHMLMGVLEYQPDDYLVKPFTKEMLDRKLRDWINRKRNLKEVERAAARGDYDRTIALCDELMGQNPKNLSQLLKFKGEILIRKGDYAEAARFYEKVLSMGDIPWALLGLGKTRFLNGLYDEAREIFERIIAQNDKIVAAHDWLAKIHQQAGDLQAVQKVLEEAIRISPKAILRQKALGEVALKNRDLGVAEKSFREAVKQGQNSFFKSPSDYTNLAQVLVEKEQPEEGLKVLTAAGREFTKSPEAQLKIAAAELLTLKKMNRPEEAAEARERISGLTPQLSGKLSSDIELDLAKSMILAGDEKEGNAIIRRLIQNNHEDEELIASVGTVFKELNIEGKGQEIIAAARDEVILINNEGVRNVKEGNLDAALALFEKAVERLPDNKVINANAAQAFMLFMKKNGNDLNLIKKTRDCLNRVKHLDPAYKNLDILFSTYKELVQEA